MALKQQQTTKRRSAERSGKRRRKGGRGEVELVRHTATFGAAV